MSNSSVERDDYLSKLPELEREIRADREKRVLESKRYVLQLCMVATPVIGAIYFASRGKDNRKYNRVGMLINICLIFFIIFLIGVTAHLAKTWSNQSVNKVETETQITETYPALATVSSTQSVSREETTMSNCFYYDKDMDQLVYYVNDVIMKFPESSVLDWKDHGWLSSGNAPNPNNQKQTIDSLYDQAGTSVMIYYDTDNGGKGKCNRLYVAFGNGETTLMGLQNNSDYYTVNQVFKGYDSVSMTEYNETKKTGVIKYVYGKYSVSVSLKSNAVSSIVLIVD